MCVCSIKPFIVLPSRLIGSSRQPSAGFALRRDSTSLDIAAVGPPLTRSSGGRYPQVREPGGLMRNSNALYSRRSQPISPDLRVVRKCFARLRLVERR